MSNLINADNLCMGCMSVLENHDLPCPKCGFDLSKYSQNMHQLKPYTILNGKYLVGRVLGEGGFGITYLGWDLNLDIRIAVKEYYPAGLVTREITSTGTSTVIPFSGEKNEVYHNGLDRFINEAKRLAKFYTLPGIVSVKDFFRENGTAYIAMEYIDGVTLKQHLASNGGKLNPNEVFELMKPLMKSLSQIHAEGIIHRDISPDNIMLTKSGDVKLLDFGAARDYISDSNKSLSVLLKPGYAPEEQYRTRGHQGPWTDVYALCATIYRMITGTTPPESLERLGEDGLVRPSQMGVCISQQAENALLKGLAVFQKDRYQSIDELYNSLYAAAQFNKIDPAHKDMQFERRPIVNTPPGVLKQTLNTAPQVYDIPKNPASSTPQNNGKMPNTIKSRTAVLAICLVVVLSSIIVIAVILSRPKNVYDPPSVGTSGSGVTLAPEATTTPEPTTTPEVTPTPEVTATPEVTTTPEITATPEVTNPENIEIGNTTGNIINLGLAAQKGDWIYYCNGSDLSLYKVRTDGTEKTKLNSDISENINVAGDWIYYSNRSDNNNIYKIQTDGNGRTKINSDYSYYITVAGDWIYYCNHSDNEYIYKIRTDGTGRTVVDTDMSSTLNVVGDWIYYSNDSNGGYMCRIRTDGTEKTVLNGYDSHWINVVGNLIYYADGGDSYNMYSIRTDGTGKTKINSDDSYYINVSGDWIYYRNGSDNFSLYRVRTDGTERTKMNSADSDFINVAGNWVYYVNYSDNNYIYKIRADGAEDQLVN